ncbi:MAG: c-type cytochrome biogenesis protein CcsB [Actinomycetota bacterium]
MAVDSALAHLSDGLFTTAIATYALAMVGYTAEYAFGRHGRVASTSATLVAAPARVGVPAASDLAAPARVLVGAGGSVDEHPTVLAGVVPTRHRALADRFGRFAVALTVLGALIHIGSIALRGLAVDRVPWGNMYEFSAVVGLLAVLAFLAALARVPQIRYLGAFVMLPVILTMFLAGTVLYAKASPLVPALQSYWLAIHVSAAASSEGILMTSAVITMLFLLRQRYDARIAAGASVRFPVSIGSRLPAPETLDKVAYRTVAFAFPIYTFGVIAGAIWAEAAWGRYWGWDPKETWAFIAWVVYAAYLHARATAGWKGRAAAWVNLLGFGAMTFNFFVVNIVVSGLHSYAGLN